MSKEEHIYNEEQIKKLCKEWQDRLKLNRWDIQINIYRESDFTNEESEGEISYKLSNGKAIIRILDPIDFPETPFLQDMEKTIVHELLHLQFAPFAIENDTSLEYMLMENTIELLAQTLVDLKREKK